MIEANLSKRREIVDFLRKHVIGKAIIAEPVVAKTDNGAITSAYEQDQIFSRLEERATGFSFDLTNLTRGTRYVHSEKGKATVAEGSMNAVRVIRYTMAERQSSDALLGHAAFVSSTNEQPDPFADAIFQVRMKLDGNALNVEETMVGFVELISAEGKPRPIAIDGKYLYKLRDNKLVVNYSQSTFDVNPNTLERQSTGENFPEQISHETPFPAPLEAI